MMAAPFTPPLVCPVLIGRTSHLEALFRFIEQACGGHGQTVLIAGEAGVGKSRLISEATARLGSSEAMTPRATVVTLVGHCFEQDTALPYAPLLDLLRTFVATCDPDAVAASLVQIAPDFVKLLPELAAFLPDPVRSTALDPVQEKRRLYQALLDLFTRLSATQPLLLIIEDLHWSDETSLEFLLYLARRVSPHPILLLLTYRSEEVHPELARFLAALDRERLAPELLLSRLSNDEVGAMIRAILALPRPVDADFLAMISTLTEGNPYFIEEILRSLITEGEISSTQGAWVSNSRRELHIPRSVQVAVQRRLDYLSPGAREVLSLAAVAGRHFDFALLQQLTQRQEAELVQLIKESITAQLVVEKSEEVFAFRHALTRQAVYTDMLARERKALHRSIAETMERLEASALEAHLGDLAYHFYAAGAWTKALEYAQRAGEQAQHLYAPRAALEHFTHAVQAARHLAVPVPLDLYRARGQAYQMLGEFEHARSDYEQALHAALTTHNRVAEWQSLLDPGYLWTERNLEQAGDYFHRAIELVREMGDQSTLAHTLNRVGNWYANREQPHEALHYHQEALEIFHRLNDQHSLAETLDLLGTTTLAAGLLPSGVTYYEQAIALLRALGDRQLLISSLGMATMRCTNYLSDTLIWLPTSNTACIHDAEEAVALARQIDWRSGEAFAHTFLGLGLASRGEYSHALTRGQAALDIALEIEHGLWMTFARFLLGSLSLDLLALSSARQHFEQALSLAKGSGSLFWLRIITGLLASTCIAQQEYVQAEAVLNAVTDSLPLSPTTAQRIA
jgi:tetratricopeptide (TPR) repeat protein